MCCHSAHVPPPTPVQVFLSRLKPLTAVPYIKQFKEYAPEISVCVGHLKDRAWEIVDRAIELGAEKVQLFKPYYSQEMIDKAHAHGIKCNIFWSDDVDEAKKFLSMGVDTILTNKYNLISHTLK